MQDTEEDEFEEFAAQINKLSPLFSFPKNWKVKSYPTNDGVIIYLIRRDDTPKDFFIDLNLEFDLDRKLISWQAYPFGSENNVPYQEFNQKYVIDTIKYGLDIISINNKEE